jgi:hypothetical protein
MKQIRFGMRWLKAVKMLRPLTPITKAHIRRAFRVLEGDRFAKRSIDREKDIAAPIKS